MDTKSRQFPSVGSFEERDFSAPPADAGRSVRVLGEESAPIEIVPLADEWLGPACGLFNELTSGLPHCLPAVQREFACALQAPPRYAHRPVRLAALRRGQMSGFAIGSVNLDPEPEGSLRVACRGDASLVGLYCEDIQAGERLLSEACVRFQAAGATRVVAFDAGENHNQLPFFNGGLGACPEQLPNTPQVLTRSGFVIAYRELQMTRDLSGDDLASRDGDAAYIQEPLFDCTVRETADDLLRTRWGAHSPDRLELDVLEGEKKVATAVGYLLSSHQAHRHAAGIGYISWLGVEPSHQRRGIGRALLKRMLRQMRRMGVRQVFLTTGSQNWRAQPLYVSAGFVVVGTSVTFSGPVT